LNTEKPRELIKKGNKETGEVKVEVEELTIENMKKAIKKKTTTRRLELMEYIQN